MILKFLIRLLYAIIHVRLRRYCPEKPKKRQNQVRWYRSVRGPRFDTALALMRPCSNRHLALCFISLKGSQFTSALLDVRIYVHEQQAKIPKKTTVM